MMKMVGNPALQREQAPAYRASSFPSFNQTSMRRKFATGQGSGYIEISQLGLGLGCIGGGLACQAWGLEFGAWFFCIKQV